jgi:beta-glucanase (GH16 family)
MLIGAALCSVLATAVSPTPVQASPAHATCAWKQTFGDEFNGTSLDRNKWDTTYPTHGSELQYYAPDAFIVNNGVLKIKAEKRSMNGYSYTSGIINTFGKFAQKYGKFHMRAKLPKGQGIWSGFWMLPSTRGVWPPEYDIMEYLGNTPRTVYMSNHWVVNGQEAKQTKYYKDGPDYSQDYHTFIGEWTSTELRWYVDGVLRFSTTSGVPQIPMVLLANLAVGGSWPGAPDATTPFPSYYVIDYIRAYQWACS